MNLQSNSRFKKQINLTNSKTMKKITISKYKRIKIKENINKINKILPKLMNLKSGILMMNKI